MEKNYVMVEERPPNDDVLSSEEQIWFPTILRYLQNRGIGDGKRGRLQRGHPVVIQNFLPAADLADLFAYTLEHEAEFHPSQVINGLKGAPVFNVKSTVRRSLIITNIEQRYKEMMDCQIDKVLPDVLRELRMDPFPCETREYQLTASNDDEFFKVHTDAAMVNGPAQNRALTYVYYFYHEPKAFTGGELRVYDTIMVDDHLMAALTTQTITPLQNQIVFFPSVLLHEVSQIHCPSQQFVDSRFTFNGWLHRPAVESN